MARRARVERRGVVSVESLEGRALMSAGGVMRGHVHVHGHVMAAEVRAGRQEAPRMGGVGDSLSDEYRFYPPDRSQARNWVELLGAKRVVNFGAFSMRSRGEPRNEGFALNWARSDATTSDMVANQLPGLLAQVRSGRVQVATVVIGDNDFRNFLLQAPGKVGDPQALMVELERVTVEAESNFGMAVNAILGANPNVKVVVGTILDLTQTPLIQAAVVPYGAVGRQVLGATSEAISAYNANVRAVAAGDPRVAVADLAAGFGQIAPEAAQNGGFIDVGGTPINVVTPGNGYNHLLLGDAYHPGTVAQGLIADTIVGAMDRGFGLRVRPLVPGQILHLARNAHQLP